MWLDTARPNRTTAVVVDEHRTMRI